MLSNKLADDFYIRFTHSYAIRGIGAMAKNKRAQGKMPEVRDMKQKCQQFAN